MSAEPPPPSLDAISAGRTVTVLLRGEFDLTSAEFLVGQLSRIRAREPRRLIFDAAQVSFMDCASARLIAGAVDWLPSGVRPVIRHPSPIVAAVLRVSGIGGRCQLEP